MAYKMYIMRAMQTVVQAVRNVFWWSVFLWLLSIGSANAQNVTGGPSQSVTFTLPSPLKNIGGLDVLVGRLLNDIVLPLGASVAAIAIIYCIVSSWAMKRQYS